jgi:SH3 domain-containing YSC84-like protein 1
VQFMKIRNKYYSCFITALAAALVLFTVAASKNELDARVRDLTDYFTSVQQDPAKAVPAEILSQAKGLVIMRNYKAGFIVGVSGGRGVAIVKNEKNSWGPVSFLKAGEGSFGFQAGAQRSDMILVLMNKDGVSLLTNPNLKMGVDIRATVGPRSAGDQANLKTDDIPVLVYGDTRGLFGGAAIEGGGLVPDEGDNKDYYGQKLSSTDILVGGKVEPTPAAKLLAEKIEQFAKPAVGAPGSATTGKTEGKATDQPKDAGTPDKAPEK